MATDLEVLERLLPKLSRQSAYAQTMRRYYKSEQPLPVAATRANEGQRQRYLALLREGVDPWLLLVVEAVHERLKVLGFRRTIDDTQADEAAAALWRRNRLAAKHRETHREALITGTAAVTVVPSGARGATIRGERSDQVYVDTDPADRSQRRNAIKVWKDPDDGRQHALVWDALHFARFVKSPDGDDWDQAAEAARHGVGVVPVVPFYNRSHLGDYASEIDELRPIADRINRTLFGRLVSQEFTAFPQRILAGLTLEPVLDGDTGEPVLDADGSVTYHEPFDIAVDRLITSENPELKWGEWSAADLKPYLAAVEQDVQHLAAISRTPPHYLLGQSGAFPSGESLDSTEAGLIAKVEERSDGYGDSWEDAIALGLRIIDPVADNDDELELATLWADPQKKVLAKVLDAAVKRKAVGVPEAQIHEDIGYTPEQIRRFGPMRARELLEQAAAADVLGVPVAASSNGDSPT